ncbi:MAG: hypothetical protein BM557_00980 [Flavobacterium sp. MedPE-SWcel]|uniref:HAD hydrolase-like protein n=1 Tax=uncultured Flavobacterium sp. TaxID=165435 RepID=UPI000922ACA5|nr:HAD hydrolase-like protein [uncultured Flavobacterium sp.]OIQ22590.1 MAG: hypothetical protein BM557_00980 [Flavobacterium sp. MedPE-SWcel]
MKTKLILFDFDGTLVDSKSILIQLYNELAEQKGYKLLTADIVDYLRNVTIKERCEYLGISLYRIPFIANRLIKGVYSKISLLEFNEEVKELLSSLNKDGCSYCIVSTNAKKNIETFFKEQQLSVPEIYTSSKVFGKDVLLKKVLKTKKLHPEEVLYVGDEARDIEACQKCNIPIAWVSWGYDSYTAIDKLEPTYKVDTLKELLNLIKQIR